MTDPEVIQHCIEKAKFVPEELRKIPHELISFTVTPVRVFWGLNMGSEVKTLIESSIYGIIFDPVFAKAFFGKKPSCPQCAANAYDEKGEFGYCCDGNYEVEAWKAQLFLLVLSEDRIDFLRRYLIDNPENLLNKIDKL
jgi:hypothetical protein